ncbi:MAG: copper-translocating P-type ATPase [Chloroflexi bacterium]|nr:copper-translocating P-type ATPase [Chloroflexota bacterium]
MDSHKSHASGREESEHDPHVGHEQHAQHGGHGHDMHANHAGHEHAPHVQPPDAGSPAHAGHDAHTDHSGHEDLFRKRFWVSLLLSVPVLAYSDMLQMWLGFSVPRFPGSEWVAPLFGLVVFVYGGLPFLDMARPEWRDRQPGMMMLISLAISVAFVYSLAASLFALGESFFWELVTLIDIMLLGHWLEMRSVRQASGSLNELAKLMPDTAERLDAYGEPQTVPAAELKTGDVVLVRPGASVPADGEVVDGESDVNEAMLTGESAPVKKRPGDKVIAGTINTDGSLRVRVGATGDQTALAGIMRLVAEAQRSKSRTQVLADKAAGWLFYIALAVAGVTAVVWSLARGFDLFVLQRVVTVLVIACPHALGLAVPLVVSISTSLAARNGILVRNRLALEAARQIDVVIFDKTGTLTQGEQGVVASRVSGLDENTAFALAAAVEGDSEHIIARAIRDYAKGKGLTPARVTDFEAIKGRGVRAGWEGKAVHLGGPRLLELLAVQPDQTLAEFQAGADAAGQTVVFLLVEEKPVAAFALADVIRPESRPAVERLQAMGIEVAMLTGDSRAVADAVAAELGIHTVFAEVLPEHKDKHVAALQAEGKRVAMVGDGVNDAPALTRADVGIAIGSGTDVAVESAGIILVRSNPGDIVKIFALSRATYAKMIQNLVWATGYNIVALPLAAGALASAGFLLSPALGAVLMSLSTVIVAVNAQFLRRAVLAPSR